MRLWTGILSALVVGVGSATLSQAGDVPEFHAFVLPEVQQVELGEMVEVTFEVDATAEQFNAYEVTLQWDPEILSFDSVVEGPLFVDACVNRFTNLSFTDSTVTYSHVILCQGLSLDGPGVLSYFRFNADAEGTSPMDVVSDPNQTFVDEGLFVWPSHPTFPRQVLFHDAEIIVGDGPTAIEGVEDGIDSSVSLQIVPNPLRGAGTIFFRSDSDQPIVGLEVLDVSGRRIRDWTLRPSVDGSVQWRAIDGRGQVLPAGTYFCRATTGPQSSTIKFQVLE